MRDGIPLRLVVIGGLVALAGAAVGTALYWRSLEASILADAPIRVEEALADEAATAAAARAVDAARGAAGEVALDEAAANRLVFREWQGDAERDARLSLEAPFARLRMAQRVRGRWLNAELVVAPYAAEGGLAFRVLSGTVGAVSISRTSGEWVRLKIERQLAHELRQNPRTAALFASLAEARVTRDGLILRFGRRID